MAYIQKHHISVAQAAFMDFEAFVQQSLTKETGPLIKTSMVNNVELIKLQGFTEILSIFSQIKHALIKI